MRLGRKRDIFVCSFVSSSENGPGQTDCVIARVRKQSSSPELLGLAHARFPKSASSGHLYGWIKSALTDLTWWNHSVIAAVPAAEMIFRTFSLPAGDTHELTQMAGLQAARILPYAQGELASSVQIIRHEGEDIPFILLGITSQRDIEQNRDVLRSAGVTRCAAAASVFGLRDLFYTLYPDEQRQVIVIDYGPRKAELIIVQAGKLLMSRSFDFEESPEASSGVLTREVKRSIDLYHSETPGAQPEALFFMGSREVVQRACAELERQLEIGIKRLAYDEIFSASAEIRERFKDMRLPLAGIAGLGLRMPRVEELLLSNGQRERLRSRAFRIRTARLWICGVASILFCFAGIGQYLDNKQAYVRRLEETVSGLRAEAAPVELMQSKIEFLDSRRAEEQGVLAILKAIAEAIPEDAVLTVLTYDESARLNLSGQAGEFSSVITFVKRLREDPVMKDFLIEMKRSTRVQQEQDNSVSFEISCLRGE